MNLPRNTEMLKSCWCGERVGRPCPVLLPPGGRGGWCAHTLACVSVGGAPWECTCEHVHMCGQGQAEKTCGGGWAPRRPRESGITLCPALTLSNRISISLCVCPWLLQGRDHVIFIQGFQGHCGPDRAGVGAQ